MANNLRSSVCSRESDAGKWRRDNSSVEMVHAERMVLGMECRLEEAKGRCGGRVKRMRQR